MRSAAHSSVIGSPRSAAASMCSFMLMGALLGLVRVGAASISGAGRPLPLIGAEGAPAVPEPATEASDAA